MGYPERQRIARSPSKEDLSVSTLLAYVFGFQILSFFLFIYTAGRIQRLFVGAMCAAGTLHVNPFGYPALIVKMANFLAAGSGSS